MSRKKSWGEALSDTTSWLGGDLRAVHQFDPGGSTVVDEDLLDFGIQMIVDAQFPAHRHQGAGNGPRSPFGNGGRFPAQGQMNRGDRDHQAGHIVRETAPGGQVAPQGQYAQFVAFEEIAGDLFAGHELHGHIQAALGVVAQFFQGIRHTVGRRRRIPVAVKGGPPFVFIFFGQVQVGLGVLFGKAGDLIMGFFDVRLVEAGLARLWIDHGKGGIGDITGPVVEDDGFVGIGKGVFQAFVAEIEFLVGRVTVETGEMGAEIPAKPGGRKIFRYRSAAQMVQPFKNPHLQTGLGQIRGHDRPVMASPDNYRIVRFVRHLLSSLFLLFNWRMNGINFALSDFHEHGGQPVRLFLQRGSFDDHTFPAHVRRRRQRNHLDLLEPGGIIDQVLGPHLGIGAGRLSSAIILVRET